MTASIGSLVLACALASTGGWFQHQRQGGWILPPGPGYGWGFPNDNPDKYGWVDNGIYLPLGADRTPDYYFPRYLAIPFQQLVFPSYYNPYVTRGQRYIPYSGGGGAHPMGGPPLGSALTPLHPYQDTLGSGPTVAVPPLSGNVEAPPINPGSTGLTP
jgi:hypothetical protein